jgi:hypothetical protein
LLYPTWYPISVNNMAIQVNSTYNETDYWFPRILEA